MHNKTPFRVGMCFGLCMVCLLAIMVHGYLIVKLFRRLDSIEESQRKPEPPGRLVNERQSNTEIDELRQGIEKAKRQMEENRRLRTEAYDKLINGSGGKR